MAVTPDELKERIEAGIPGSAALVSGDGQHFRAEITSPAFAGLSRIAQHKLVYDVFGPEIGDRIHALSIKTTPTEASPMSEPETNELRDAITSAIADNPVILFMKGNPDAPACGFSARTVSVLNQLDTAFAAVDVLPDPRIRQELSAVSGLAHDPQLFVDGELVGGCDIVVDMYESGELAELLGVEPGDEATVDPVAAEPAPLTIENRL